MKKNLWILIIIISSLMIFFLSHLPNHSRLKTASVLTQPRKLDAFEFKDTNGHKFSNNQLIGKWTFLFFGFTNCNAVCPITMSQLAQMYEILQVKKAQLPQVVMVTIDSKRDRLKKLKLYVKSFNNNFIGARGFEHTVKELAKQIGLTYTKHKQTSGVMLKHSGTVMLINPQGELKAFFTAPHDPTDLAYDYIIIRG